MLNNLRERIKRSKELKKRGRDILDPIGSIIADLQLATNHFKKAKKNIGYFTHTGAGYSANSEEALNGLNEFLKDMRVAYKCLLPCIEYIERMEALVKEAKSYKS